MAIKILHMDNEEDMLTSVQQILEKEGYEVTNVSTGKEAVKEIDAHDYDLLILDIMMPDLSGWDVFTRVTKVKPEQKVIFLTVLEISPERKKQLEEHGIADYILKPFDRDYFVNHVKALLGD